MYNNFFYNNVEKQAVIVTTVRFSFAMIMITIITPDYLISYTAAMLWLWTRVTIGMAISSSPDSRNE